MFNFSANHLFLLSRTEYPSCAVFLLRDLDTQRVYRLHDFSKAQLIRPDVAYCVAGKVNSADKLYLSRNSHPLQGKRPVFSIAWVGYGNKLQSACTSLSLKFCQVTRPAVLLEE